MKKVLDKTKKVRHSGSDRGRVGTTKQHWLDTGYVFDNLNKEWVSAAYFDKLIALRVKHKKWYSKNIAHEKSLVESFDISSEPSRALMRNKGMDTSKSALSGGVRQGSARIIGINSIHKALEEAEEAEET